MAWAGDAASKRQFESFAAEASDTLFRTGYLMTGNPKDAEVLVQETFLRVARRWNWVRSMDHPVAYARRHPRLLGRDGQQHRLPRRGPAG